MTKRLRFRSRDTERNNRQVSLVGKAPALELVTSQNIKGRPPAGRLASLSSGQPGSRLPRGVHGLSTDRDSHKVVRAI